MKINKTPQTERKTSLEFTDKELQLIQRALLNDVTTDANGGDENGDLYVEFIDLLRDLNLELI
jgi:hypothetical protein